MATKTSNGLEFTKNILFKASFLMSGKQMCNCFLCSMMDKLLVICTAAFGRSSPNISMQDSIPLDYFKTDVSAQCATYQPRSEV